MLSYDSPISVNGQKPPSAPVVMAAPRQSMPSAPRPAPRAPAPAPALSNGALTNGATSTRSSSSHATEHHIWLVTGPAGCGKSTVAKYLANSLHLPYIEGDEFHPQSNIDKMSAGIPLTDADRWDWLTALREASIRELDRGNNGAVLTCSALKRKYRDVIRVAPYFMPNLHLHFIYLDASEEMLLQRVMMRQNHYMGANMVHSQFDILEPPTADEVDVIRIDVSRPADVVMAESLDQVLKTMDRIQEASNNKK
ncbi:P-loop containing nucleoside triphosphate hydrolase protein [Podospora didyma]|uniref:Gluconokinase n=1 Tax=Podospora didyma TaxID=330526 RepID=A0AAE0P7C0_9PEZI|nr:P-loop containing nucleoside triphosphate hydrolase protein [Podospora didyma]